MTGNFRRTKTGLSGEVVEHHTGEIFRSTEVFQDPVPGPQLKFSRMATVLSSLVSVPDLTHMECDFQN